MFGKCSVTEWMEAKLVHRAGVLQDSSEITHPTRGIAAPICECAIPEHS